MRVAIKLLLLALLAVAFVATAAVGSSSSLQSSSLVDDADDSVLLSLDQSSESQLDAEAEADVEAEVEAQMLADEAAEIAALVAQEQEAEAETETEAEAEAEAEPVDAPVLMESEAEAEVEAETEAEAEVDAAADISAAVSALPAATPEDVIRSWSAAPSPDMPAPIVHHAQAEAEIDADAAVTPLYSFAEHPTAYAPVQLSGTAMRLQQIAGSAPAPVSPFATVRHDHSWAQSESYCKNLKMTLCKADKICKDGKVNGGSLPGRRFVAVSDAADTWLSVGKEGKCKTKKSPYWSGAVYSGRKGLAACCIPDGSLASAALLTRWEGHLINLNGGIYMIENGKSRGIPNPKTLECLGFKWTRVSKFTQQQFDKIPRGDAIPAADCAKDEKPFVHATLGYQHEGGHPWDELEGYLVNVRGSTIYMVEGGAKRAIPDTKTFDALGFEFPLIRFVPQGEIARIPEGRPFKKLSGARASKSYVHPTLGDFHFGRSHGARKVNAADFIRSSVLRLLGRPAAQADFDAHLPGLQANRNSVGAFLRALLRSSEFVGPHFYTPVVKALYKQFLGRAADSAGLAHHTKSYIRNGLSAPLKLKVVEFAKCAERAGKFLREHVEGAANNYRHILGREPESAAAKQGWGAAARAHGWNHVHDGFLNSAEYVNNFKENAIPGHPAVFEKFVKKLYQKLLNREAEPGGLAGWQNFIKQNGVSKIFDGFLDSAEFKGKSGTNGFYDEDNKPMVLAL